MLSARAAVLLLLVCLASLATAWTKEDHEIFRLNDDVQAHEGSNVTFYSLLNVQPRASLSEITKSYKNLSRTLHPDKARSRFIANYDKPPKIINKPGAKPTTHVHKAKKPSQSEINRFLKEATARFERLSRVVEVLREDRSRYDHFLSNGFPVWRGTGYYYQRYRPGLGTVVAGLFIFLGGGVHYGVLYLSWKQRREFAQRYVAHARKMAWGDDSSLANIPGLGTPGSSGSGTNTPVESEESMQWNRKQKRAMEKEKRRDSKKPAKKTKAENIEKEEISAPTDARITSGPVGAKKRTRAENGKILIVDSVGNVYLEEETEEGEVHEFLIDPDEIPAPSLGDTFLARGPKFLYNQSLGRLLHKQTVDEIVWEANGAPLDELPEAAPLTLEDAVSSNPSAEARRRRKGKS